MRYLFLIFFLAFLNLAKGQVQINVHLPVNGLSLKSQLWSFNLINQGPSSTNVKVEIRVIDFTNNQVVFSATSKTILLPMGSRGFQMADVMPVTYNSINPSYNIDPSPSGFLPIGKFTVCYSLLISEQDFFIESSQDCDVIEIEPLNPPILIEPENNDVIDNKKPFFSWIPPSPVSHFYNLDYTFNLVEVKEFQSPEEAIQFNLPIYSQNIIQTALQYPNSLNGLSSGKEYAWRVSARSNLSIVAHSEVYKFSINSNNDEVGFVEGSFIKATVNKHESFGICGGTLRFEYFNKLNTDNVKIKIKEISGNSASDYIYVNNEFQVNYGINYKEIDLSKEKLMKDGSLYLLTIENAQNELSYLNFLFKKK